MKLHVITEAEGVERGHGRVGIRFDDDIDVGRIGGEATERILCDEGHLISAGNAEEVLGFCVIGKDTISEVPGEDGIARCVVGELDIVADAQGARRVEVDGGIEAAQGELEDPHVAAGAEGVGGVVAVGWSGGTRRARIRLAPSSRRGGEIIPRVA